MSMSVYDCFSFFSSLTLCSWHLAPLPPSLFALRLLPTSSVNAVCTSSARVSIADVRCCTIVERFLPAVAPLRSPPRCFFLFLCRWVATPPLFASTFLGPVDGCRSTRRVYCLLPLAPPPLNYLCTIRARALLLLVELILISSSAATRAPRSDRVRCVSLPLPLCLFASTLARSLVLLFPPSSHSAGCAVICCAVFARSSMYLRADSIACPPPRREPRAARRWPLLHRSPGR